MKTPARSTGEPVEAIDGHRMAVCGIPLGELVSLSPQQVACLALTRDLPTVPQLAAFDRQLQSALSGETGDERLRTLAMLFDEIQRMPGRFTVAGGQSGATREVVLGELTRTFFAMTIATSDVDHGHSDFDPAGEIAGASAWIDKLVRVCGGDPSMDEIGRMVGESIASRGGVPGFGHPRLSGLDPRCLALAAFVGRTFPDAARAHAMTLAMREAPAYAPESRWGTGNLPNLYLPTAVALAELGVDVAGMGARMVGVSWAATRALFAPQQPQTCARGE